jgi:hypothetical protein
MLLPDMGDEQLFSEGEQGNEDELAGKDTPQSESPKVEPTFTVLKKGGSIGVFSTHLCSFCLQCFDSMI